MAFEPFSGATVDWSRPILFVQKERPYTSEKPVNLGYLEKVSIDGGESVAGFDACNSLTPLKTHPEKHTIEVKTTIMELDYELLQVLFGINFNSDLMDVPATRQPVRCQTQLIIPQMADKTKCAFGLWFTNSIITFDYGRDNSTKNPLGLGIIITAEPEDGVVLSDGKGILYRRIKNGAPINIEPPNGTGYSIAKWDS